MTRPVGRGPAGPGTAVAAGLVGSAALIAGLTLLARATGFGRWFVFAGTVHGGCVGTVYATANQLPNVLFEVAAGGALAGAVVPLLAAAAGEGRRGDVDRIASALLSWTLLVLVPVALLLAVAARPVTAALLGGDPPGGGADGGGLCAGGADLAARMLVVFAPQVPLYGVGVVLAGVLQAHRRFVWPALAPLVSSLVAIACYLGYGVLAGAARERTGRLPTPAEEAVLAGGTTLAVVALSLPMLIPVWRAGVRLRFTLRFPAGAAARARALAAAGLGALLAQQGAVVVTLLVANRVGGQGTLPVTQYVHAVYLLPYAVLAVPLATAAFPELSHRGETGDTGGYVAAASRSTRLVVLVSCLGAAVLVAAAPALQALFAALDRGAGTALTGFAAALTAFAPGLLGWGLVAQAGRALYAVDRGRAAAGATMTGWAVVMVTAPLIAGWLSAGGMPGSRAALLGIGAGNTAGMTVAGGLLLLAVRPVIGGRALAVVLRACLLGVVAAGAAGAAGRRAGDAWTDAVPSAAPRPGAGVAAAIGAVPPGLVSALVATVAFGAVLLLVDRSEPLGLLPRRRRPPAPAGDEGGGRST